MNIRSVKFIKGVVKADEVLEDGKPQIAFIGRSNVGKSSIINALTKQKSLAKISSFPGRTQQINLFLVNKAFYLLDLPGYGFAQLSWEGRQRIQQLIHWYLLDSHYEQKKVLLIIDANVGMTAADSKMLENLEKQGKNILIVANKVDKIKKSEYVKKLQKIKEQVGNRKIILFSSEENIGVNELGTEMLK